MNGRAQGPPVVFRDRVHRGKSAGMRAVRLAAFCVVIVLALLVSACGGDEGGGEAEGSDLRVAVVTDLGGLNDRGFNALANEGLQRAEDDLGVEGRVFISKAANDYVPNLTRAARDGYDLVIGNGFLMGDALATVAGQFPDTNFAIIDFPWAALEGAPMNARGLVFAEQEAGYLTGVAAATVGEGSSVSAVGGQDVPAVVAFLAGYEAGAKATDPDVRVVEAYSQDFVDQAKCKELALNQIQQGAKVVFQVAGQCGLGVIDAAKEKGVQAIGVDADQSYLGDQVMTSAMKNVDQAVFESIKGVQDDTYKGGADTVFDVKSGGVGIGKTNAEGAKYAAQVQEIQDKIASGELTDIPDTVK